MAASVWKGYITFGLISIPVRLVRAARSERVPLRELYSAKPLPVEDSPSAEPAPVKGPVRIDRKPVEPEPAEEPIFEPVRRIAVPQSTNEAAPSGSLTKGYEYERGRYVTIAPEELRSITPATSPDMEIVEFVRLLEIDPVYFEASYYVKPEEAGRKPYALLYEAMREAGFAAIAQFAMHRRERVAVVRPGPAGMIAHTMYFASEVRSSDETPADRSLVTAKEVAMAKTLVTALAGPFDPSKFRDLYRDRLEALIAAKVEGRETVAVTDAPRIKPAIDIMEALRKSLEAVKRPPAKAETTKRRLSSKTSSK